MHTVLDPSCYADGIDPATATPEQVVAAAGCWLTSRLPDTFCRWTGGTSPEAKRAVAAALPNLIRAAVQNQRRFATTPGWMLSGPYAGMIPGLARASLRALPDNARWLATQVGATMVDVEAALVDPSS